MVPHPTISQPTTPTRTPTVVTGCMSPSSEYNLIGTGGSGGLVDRVNGNQVGVTDPKLMMAFYGGPTQAIALMSGSPAIDRGSNARAVDPQGNPLQFDQRSTGFVRIVNGTVDIGAYEYLPLGAAVLSVEWGTTGAGAMLQTAADGPRLFPLGRRPTCPGWASTNCRSSWARPRTCLRPTSRSAARSASNTCRSRSPARGRTTSSP